MIELPPEKRILEAVIVCIEQDGFDHLTTRKIAEQAGVNIAAINYYFRSKERLVEEALGMTLQHMKEDLFAILDRPERTFLENFEEIAEYLIDGGKRFPGTVMAHLYGILVERKHDTPALHVFRGVFEHMVQRAVQTYPQLPAMNIRSAMAQVMSSAFFSMLSPDFFQVDGAITPLDPIRIKRLARYTARMFEQCIQIELDR